jgi:hypothetical protein
MTTDTFSPARRTVARSCILVFLIFFGLRLFGVTLTEEAPVAAAEIPTAMPTRAALKIFIRAEWLNPCNPAWTVIGLYTATDAPCQPSALAPLTRLQSQLALNGLLTPDEYLSSLPNAHNPACSITVLNSADQTAGFICSDANGLYRADANGTASAKRVQLAKVTQ